MRDVCAARLAAKNRASRSRSRRRSRSRSKRKKKRSSSGSSSSRGKKRKKDRGKKFKEKKRSSSSGSSSGDADEAGSDGGAAGSKNDRDKDKSKDDEPTNPEVEKAKSEVLEKLMKLREVDPKEERIKRWRALLREWHPDKNLDRAEVATAVFQFLQKGKQLIENV